MICVNAYHIVISLDSSSLIFTRNNLIFSLHSSRVTIIFGHASHMTRLILGIESNH
jgi:hypothetical protein